MVSENDFIPDPVDNPPINYIEDNMQTDDESFTNSDNNYSDQERSDQGRSDQGRSDQGRSESERGSDYNCSPISHKEDSNDSFADSASYDSEKDLNLRKQDQEDESNSIFNYDQTSEDYMSGFGKIYHSSEEESDDSESDVPDEEVQRMLDDALDVSEDSEKSEDSEESEDSESDVPDEEVERMLEEALGSCDSSGNLPRKRSASLAGFDKKRPFEEKEKTLLIEKRYNHFDVLPEGWLQVTHNSGLHIYLHKQGRVCTLSRPYFLGPGNLTKHDIPLSGIPCLNYKKALEAEAESAANIKSREASAHKQEDLPCARIETIRENIEQNNLNPTQVNEYAQRRFQFQTVEMNNTNGDSETCKMEDEDGQGQLQRPTLPEGTKLISFPVLGNDNDENNKNPKREWIMNPNGKSYVCILHEYVQHALKKQPSYRFSEVENEMTPYSATVTINDMQYGVGTGTSKKQAKSAAAKATLEILIPEMRTKIATDTRMGGAATSKARNQDLSLFNEIKIGDPRVAEFCAKTTEPSPHDVLLTCLQRNFGLGDLHISYQGNTLRRQRNEFTMRVGKHSATVICNNKRDGKQRASQAILQALHPHIKSWGALLRLYGTRSVKSFKEKKMEEQEITLLQSKAAVNSPNFAILDKLRLELRKIKERQDLEISNPEISSTSDFPSVSTCALNSVDL